MERGIDFFKINGNGGGGGGGKFLLEKGGWEKGGGGGGISLDMGVLPYYTEVFLEIPHNAS